MPTWTRRSVLGAMLLGATGCGGVRTPIGSIGPGLPDRLVEGAFYSRRVQRSVGYAIAYPSGHGQGDRLPVVVVLHARGGDHRSAISQLHLDRVLPTGVALATVDGGSHSYWHRRADGSDSGAMVVDELLPKLSTLGLDTGRVGLFGWSMGGYGALLLAARHPHRFRAVATSSAALFGSAGATAPGAFDGPADFYRNDVGAHPAWLRGIPLRLACGDADPFAATNHVLARRTGARTDFGPGAHDAAYWRRTAPGQLRFLARHLR